MLNVKDFYDYIQQAKSKNTAKNYKNGIRKFCQWYGKEPNEVLKERFEDLQSANMTTRRRFNREIEKVKFPKFEGYGRAYEIRRSIMRKKQRSLWEKLTEAFIKKQVQSSEEETTESENEEWIDEEDENEEDEDLLLFQEEFEEW